MNLRTFLFIFLLISTMNITAQVTFTDASVLFPNSANSEHPVAVVDMNADGLDDIIRTDDGLDVSVLFQQESGADFEEFFVGSMSPGLPSSAITWGMAVSDLDRDGRNDIMLGGKYNAVYLYKWNENTESYSEDLELSDEVFVQGMNSFDIDNDGHLDIFICHDDGLSFVLENNGSGDLSYTDNILQALTDEASDNSGNYGSCFVDVDNNGHCDLYIAKCRQGVNDSSDPRRINLLYLNDGNGGWTSAGQIANLNSGAQSWSADFADFDNDGDMDVFIGNHFPASEFLINDGSGVFTDNTEAAGLSDAFQFLVIQSVWSDFNNDGYSDLLVSGGGSSTLSINNGDGTFTNYDDVFGDYPVNSFALGDLNNDGSIDAYVTSGGYGGTGNNSDTDRLYFNDGNNNHFLKVALEGVGSNINGIGARVSITGPWGTQIRDVMSGQSYGIMNSLTQHFGLGSTTTIDELMVTWPSGTTDILFDVAADQQIVITEGMTTGLFEIESAIETIDVYPNPAHEQVFITLPILDLPSDANPAIRIMDATGRVVMEEVVSGETESFDISSLSAGTYIMAVIAEGRTVASGDFTKF